MPDEDRHDSADLSETSFQIRRALKGDTVSLTWVVAHLGPLLHAQARYRLSPARQDEADDVVHDVWLSALPRLGDLRARNGRFTPVLVRYLSKTLLHRVQRRQRDEVRPSQLEATSEPEVSPVVTEASRREIHGLLLDAIAGLGERDREVLVLRGVEQWSNREVAELTGELQNTVAVRYRRALERLRGCVPDSLLDELVI